MSRNHSSENYNAKPSHEEEEINIKQLIESYARYWKGFLIGIGIALLLAVVYLRYTPKIYEVKSKILLHEQDKSEGDLAGLFENSGLGVGSAFVADQMDVMKSRRILRQVIQANRLNITYYLHGRIKKEKEVLPEDNPLRLVIMEEGQNSALDSLEYAIDIRIRDDQTLEVKEEDKAVREVALGSEFSSPIGKLMLVPQERFKNYIGKTISVRYRPAEKLIGSLERQIQLTPNKDKQSFIVNLSMNSSLPKKAEQVLDTLVKKYNDDITRDRRRVVDATTEFITSRLEIVSEDLKEADAHVAQFKETQEVTDMGVETELYLQSADATNKKLLEVETQLRLSDMLREKVEGEGYELLPSNLGLEDSSIEQSIQKFNELILERDDLLQTATESNPVVQNLNRSLEGLGKALMSSLDNYKQSLSVKVASLDSELGGYRGRLSSSPGQEQDFKPILRRQQIVETLYLFLLEKREESDIKGAAVPEILKVVNEAFVSDNPVAPKSKIILLAAIILGFLVPFGLVYLKFLLDNKVHNRADVEAYLDVPIVGQIPKSEGMVSISNDMSEVAEAFRILRTNMAFLLNGKKDAGSPVVFITSTVAKEGKSFVANNLSKILAISDKKVLLIGADIRNPRVLEYLDIEAEYKDHPGLTHYLSNSGDFIPQDLILQRPGNFPFDVIPSGPIPPNPAELLLNGKFGEVIAHAKQHYDYVIVDTAPVALVSDTLAIMEYADLTLYTVRADFLETEMLNLPKDLHQEKRITNMAVVLNDIDFAKGGYGYYGYRYGYGHTDNLSLFDRLRNLFNRV